MLASACHMTATYHLDLPYSTCAVLASRYEQDEVHAPCQAADALPLAPQVAIILQEHAFLFDLIQVYVFTMLASTCHMTATYHLDLPYSACAVLASGYEQVGVHAPCHAADTLPLATQSAIILQEHALLFDLIQGDVVTVLASTCHMTSIWRDAQDVRSHLLHSKDAAALFQIKHMQVCACRAGDCMESPACNLHPRLAIVHFCRMAFPITHVYSAHAICWTLFSSVYDKAPPGLGSCLTPET